MTRSPYALPSIRSGPALLGGILVVSLAARMWLLTDGVPFAVGIDEPAIVDRALRILRTGDWNTHVFDYPPLVIYLHALVAIVRFLAGALNGEWASLDQFQIASVYASGRLVAALIGVGTVWITYRLGCDLESSAVGLVAAAQLAVVPLHVRESHFILTDVPVTALTTAAVWLSVRAASSERASAYAAAGVTAGLAAAAKYNGAVALVPLVVVWVTRGRTAGRGYRTLAVALGSAAAAFVLAAPFTILDLPAFLDGFAAQASRFAATRVRGEDHAWLVYIKHLSLAGRWWLPLAGFGAVMALVRRPGRLRWAAAGAFGAAYFYVLATHAPIFARYALPLVPIVCVFAAKGLVEAVKAIAPRRQARLAHVLTTICAVAIAAVFLARTIAWLDQLRRKDTRDLAAGWLVANVTPGTRMVVENSGPTYLATASFVVGSVELIADHPVELYRKQGFEYLVISSDGGRRDPAYADAGTVVYEIAPTPERWGPPIRIVRMGTYQESR